MIWCIKTYITAYVVIEHRFCVADTPYTRFRFQYFQKKTYIYDIMINVMPTHLRILSPNAVSRNNSGWNKRKHQSS